jgi:hypothetical protein
MTNCNSTQHQENDRTIHFACVSEMYQLHADATPTDVRDQLEARLSQLSAMLIMTSGAGFETFNNWSDPIKHNYLWACSMLADECDELVKHV